MTEGGSNRQQVQQKPHERDAGLEKLLEVALRSSKWLEKEADNAVYPIDIVSQFDTHLIQTR